jgi:UDP:flavonoid glycosyltransferase YjiC (YdhE family)
MSRSIAFVAPPFAGHLNPLVALARGAMAAGHTVEVLTGPGKVDVVREAGVPAATLPTLGNTLETIVDTSGRVGSNPLALAQQMRAVFGVLGGIRDDLAARWRAARPDVVVADFIAVPAGLAADVLGIPWITAIRGAFQLEGRRGPPSYLGGLEPWPGPLGAARDRLGWLAVRWGKDALAACFAPDLRRLGLRRRRPDGGEGMYSPYRILAIELKELEFDRDWPPQVRFIGSIADNPERPMALELPSGRPRVLVTLGTHLPWAKATLAEDAAALASQLPEVAFLVSMGRAQGADPRPRQAAANVFVYDFVPYTQYLPEMDAVIHHGGAGVTGACIHAGKPALVFPRDYDQFDFAARIAHYGLGLRVDRLDSAATAAALRRVLTEDMPAVARFQAIARRYDPVAGFLSEVADLLEETS